ncbi:hypothetical protein PG985_008570 [Apiospora marii]|uniref:Cyanovirin-N domain-containing protein n=1 Tax=Apiospora marii TaxID=335849 RepID=A0ABR1R4P4_9PEZI
MSNMAPSILRFLALALMACLFAAADPTPFNISCSSWSYNGDQLMAVCDAKTASYASALNLDDCYANYGGNLAPASKGMFSQTCQNRQVVNYLDHNQAKPQPILSADCSQGPGQATNHGEVNLADVIVNDNGILKCFDDSGCYACIADGCVGCAQLAGLPAPDYQCDCNDPS